MRDLEGAAALVTGGTAGIGLATGLALGRRGAHVTLTCRWGSVEPEEVKARFEAAGAPAPTILEADARNAEATAEVMESIASRHEALHVFVSNVGFAQLVEELEDYSEKGLAQSIGYSAWPLAGHLKQASARFGRPPRYAVAVSSCGADEWHPNYAFAGAAKATLETLVRYLARRLGPACLVNAVRARWVHTESLEATVGEDFVPFARRHDAPGLLQTPEEIADVIMAMTSGWLDGMRGQVVTVDHGTGFYDNAMRLYAARLHEET